MNQMLTIQDIHSKAKKNRATIGIGLGERPEVVKQSISKAQELGLADVEVFESSKDLLEALSQGKIDGAVRGTLSAKETMADLKNCFKIDKVVRLALLQTENEELFFLAPVGITEGRNFEEKMEIIKYGSAFLTKLGIDPKVGILSGGRLEDEGRGETIDKSLGEGNKLESETRKEGFAAVHYGILIEEAVGKANLIITPDGITGNLIFRAFCLIGGGKAIGAPLLGFEKTFIDTSRSKGDYTDSIALASALVDWE